MDAKSAPTGSLENRQERGFPQRPQPASSSPSRSTKNGAQADQADECREFVSFRRPLTLQDSAQQTDTIAIELLNPVQAHLSALSEDSKNELQHLGWNRATDAEPLDDGAAVIWWTRQNSSGDIMDEALHLLNPTELAWIEADSLSLALDDLWDAPDRLLKTAANRVRESLKRRFWKTPNTTRKNRLERLQLADDTIRLDVGNGFSRTPGPRYRRQGDASGEAFRDDHLLPAVHQAQKTDKIVIVNIGTVEFGCPIGWLSEVFGGARIALGQDEAIRRIRIVSTDPTPSADVADAYHCLTL